MSTPAQPPYPPHQQAEPQRVTPRPSAWWWTGPALLVVAALVALTVGILVAVSGVRGPVTTLPRDGSSYTVDVDTDDGNTLWAEDGLTVNGCTVVEASTGREVVLEHRGGRMQMNDMVAMRTFTARSSPVEVTCQPLADESDSLVGIGPRPRWDAFAGGLALSILAPLVLGGIAVIWAIVLIVLFATRPSRRSAQA